jgi:site-specific recombinase XerD
MDSSTPLKPISLSWLRDSSLARCEAPYRRWLGERGYTNSTVRNYLQCLVHFARWATIQRLTPESLSVGLICRFVDEHLPHCDCSRRVQRSRTQVRAALAQLLPALDAAGVAYITEAPNAIDHELNGFDAYLRDRRGLSASTRLQRGKILTGLLKLSPQASGRPVWQDATQLRQYINACLERWSCASGAVLASSLRSYLRYRASLGDDVTTLLPVIASPAVWRLAGLPKTLTSDEVERVLNSFDPSVPSWRRGRAVAHCVARLGLRSAEVVGLELEDLDWSAGTIRLRGCKSRRVDVMPMPPSVGHAIVEYLQHERPACKSRKVFVRHVAPVEQPLLPGLAKRVVLDAYLRCGGLAGV